ncbi:DUF6542 domain-containing protein [Gordonia sp. 852002-10350_SCH5691597]|uniref:DUF6542 domain-containing protein n=1 Tax=Gordonia sp. 852002-10350_SCH5691597 TaxID=1834085 RepID=UPI003FA54AD7
MPFPQRSRSAVPVDQQSVLPNVRGIPWWGAVLVAAAFTAVGAIIDANHSEALGSVFNFFYLVGCVVAVLAVRRRALFTAVAQPPLIAFGVGVITLYGLNADEASGLKSLIFKVLLPIANDFPWILFTFLVTLALGVGRWYITRGQTLTDSPAPKRRSRGVGTEHTFKNPPPKNPTPKDSTSRTSEAARARAGDSKTKRSPQSGAAKSDRGQQPGTAQRRAKAARPESDATPRTRKAPAQPTSTDDPRPRRRASGEPGERPKGDPTRGQRNEGERSAGRERPARDDHRERPARERPATDDVARPRPPRPAQQDPRPRATAGQVQRTAAGEQLDGQSVRATAAADLDRYEPATRAAGSAVYQTTRARNQR